MATCLSFQNTSALKSVLALFLQTCFVLGTIKSIGVFLPEIERNLGLTSTDIGLALGLFDAFAFGPGSIKSIGVFLPEIERNIGLTSTDIGLALGLFDAFAFGPEIERNLGLTSTDIGLALGLFGAFAFGPGPVVVYLYQRLHGGYRRGLVMTGSFLAPGGLILASWATNNVELAVCLSAAGLGSNILSISLVIALSGQSGDSFGIFYGIGKSGYAFGMALVPLLADFLMGIYGWRGSLMIIGGIMAHLIPLTLMVDINAGNILMDDHGSTNSDEGNTDADFDTTDEESTCSDAGLLQEASLCRRDKAPIDVFHAEFTHANVDTGSGNGNCPLEEFNEETLRESKLMKSLSTSHLHQEMSNLSRKGNTIIGPINCSWLYATTCRIISNSIYYRDRWMILLMLVTLVFAMLDGGWHAFLIPRAVDRGISTTKALSLAYSAATAAFIGRCFGGLLLKYKLFSGQCWFLLLTFLNITSLLADIFVPKFALMIVTSFITSITVAERNILTVVICKDRAPQSEFPVILASSEIVFGLGAFLGVSLSGYVADLIGTFNASFMFLAAVDAVVFCLMIPPIIAEKSQEHDTISL